MNRWRWTSTWAVALWLGLSSPGLGLQLSELRDLTRLKLRDTTSDSNFQKFTDARILTLLNEAQRQIVNQTWLLSGTTTFGLVSGTAEYPMPDDFLAPLRVTISNKALEETTYQGLDADRTDWTTRSSTPTAYYITGYSNSLLPTQMGFVAKPSTNSVNSVTVFYAKRAADLVSDTDVPFGGKKIFLSYHDLLTDCAAGMGWLIQGRADLAGGYFTICGSRSEQLKRNNGMMPNYNPSLRGERPNNR